MEGGAVTGTPRLVLRGEGLMMMVLASLGFAWTGLSWWLFALLFFAPDLGFLAYAAGPRLGAVIYNVLHTTMLPAALALCGWLVDASLLLGIAAVWAAHIGFDRMVGYGLKYGTGFGDTHLGRIGRSRVAA